MNILKEIADGIAFAESTMDVPVQTIYLGPEQYQSAVVVSLDLMDACGSPLFTVNMLFGRKLQPMDEDGMIFSER